MLKRTSRPHFRYGMRRCRIQLSTVRGDTSYRSAMPSLFVNAAPIRSAAPDRFEDEFFLSSALAINTKRLRFCVHQHSTAAGEWTRPVDYARFTRSSTRIPALTWQGGAAL